MRLTAWIKQIILKILRYRAISEFSETGRHFQRMAPKNVFS